MNIIYLLTVILIVGLHMLIYKKEEKQNFLKFFAITICLLLCYNIVICVILSFIKIKSTLITLSIINIIISVLLGLKIFLDKKIQKYFINKMDILAIIFITIITIIISIMQYGIPLNIKYSVTDASTHYFAADEFYNYSALLMEENSDKVGFLNLDFLMPGAYINTGLIFKIFSNLINENYFCKLYIIFEICMWYLSGILMYVLLINNNEGKNKNKILALIFSIFYMLAYPLNSLISGFSYLQVGLNIIICLLIVMKLDIKLYYKYILIFLLNFALMFSYYYFAPVVFLAIFIQILSDVRRRNEKIFSAPNMLNLLLTLVIPGLFGIMHFVIFQQIKYGKNPLQQYSNGINTPGPIYNNLITTVLIFIILSIFYIIYCLKNKKQNISNKMLILSIIFTIIGFVGMKLQKVSEYYYFKIYYMLWIFLVVSAFNAINILKERFKKVTYIGIILYCIGIMIAIIFNKNILFFDIYQKNFNEIFWEYKVISHKELEIFEYYNKEIDTENNMDNTTYLYSNRPGRQRWFYALTRNAYIYINTTWVEAPFTDIQQFFDSEKKHCIIFKEDNPDIYDEIENIENIKILFKNKDGVIIQKNYTE